MKEFRFRLEPYHGLKSRYTCPGCGKGRVFTRYMDTQSGELLPGHVGICSRLKKCGYHYPPREYFRANPGRFKSTDENHLGRSYLENIFKPKPISYIPRNFLKESLKKNDRNNFCKFLEITFGKELANYLIIKYYIGTSSLWAGASIFWQIDINGNIRTGKIMDYDSVTGHRIKYIVEDGESRSRISWVHDFLKKSGQLKDFELGQCLFGEHLLESYNRDVIAIVESEKTAIISSVYHPQFTWLACGSLQSLSISKCKPLEGKKIILFPDLNCLEDWQKKAVEIRIKLPCKVIVSDLLEKHASESDKSHGYDIADYLLRKDNKLSWALSNNNYPLFWDF